MKLKLILTGLLIFNLKLLFGQYFFSDPLAHTYSILARDTVTGEMGVAVQSHWFSVGSIVSWGEAGVGVVATQSFVNPSYRPRGLALLKQGKSPEEVVNILTASDSARDMRQLAVLDVKGRSAAFTGSRCIPFAGHHSGANYSVQANLMLNEKVWPAMEQAFKKTKGPLAERMIAALEAGQAEGGDIRGMQSASILIVKGAATGNVWEDRVMDLRVEDHQQPVRELKRLVKVFRAYEHMNAGDLYVEKNDMKNAFKEYSAAEKMFPKNIEMKFWHAVTLVNQGFVAESIPLFRPVFEKDRHWMQLIPRLRKTGHLTCSDEQELQILNSIEMQK